MEIGTSRTKQARCLSTVSIGAWIVILLLPGASNAEEYRDGRPAATLRLDAVDQGIVLRHGGGPEQCDLYGARDVWVFESNGTYYMHYDAAGPTGWLSSLAVSPDLVHWKKRGPILELGPPGSDDSKSASYGVTYKAADAWHLFYLGTLNTSPPPNSVPAFPYLTMKATGDSPEGPWRKQREVTPFRPAPDTYYSATASPGHVVEYEGEYLQFFSASTHGEKTLRTLGIARTKDLDGDWRVDPTPVVPLEEQIENSSLYYEKANETWFLFTNHIGIKQYEYTDAIWVYWTKDLNRWDPKNKAIVLEGRNCSWSKEIVGLPSVLPVGNRLAILYDGLEGDSLPNAGVESHMKRDVGLAWLNLPLEPPRDHSSSAQAEWTGDVYSDDRVILLPVYGGDREAVKDEVNFHVSVPKELPLKKKVERVCYDLQRFRFGHLPITVDGIEIRDGKKIARIHLHESAPLKKGIYSGAWNQRFSGSTGGHFTAVTLIRTLLQPDYRGEWIDCVEFYYEGKPIPDVWDHIRLSGTFCRGEKGPPVW